MSLLKVMVCTDTHVGYAEKDPVRGEDSFLVFEEILKHAKKNAVDFILHGGDLFHDNKPSRRAVHRVTELLRQYTLGPDTPTFKIISDQKVNFHTRFGKANFEDANFKVATPMFAIHGNHDDPAGDGRLAALDLLSASNLVNYFGKAENVDDISVYPILLEKGDTRVALYGLGNIRDERLYRTFQQKKVKLVRPAGESEDWFNIFVLHQNRVHHNEKACIHEVMLDDFLDIVIWGHEHECRIMPEPSAVAKFQIIQPGSPVATSLIAGEARQKQVGILEIMAEGGETKWRIRPITLESVRPFLMEDISLSDCTSGLDMTIEEDVIEFLSEQVEALIAKAKASFKQKARPLIRLRVDYAGGVRCHPARFGQRFVGKVANPSDILIFTKKRTYTKRDGKMTTEEEEMEELEAMNPEVDCSTVSEVIRQNLSKAKDKDLTLLPEDDLLRAVEDFAEKDSRSAISDVVDRLLKHHQEKLLSDYENREAPEAKLIREHVKLETGNMNLKGKEMQDEDDMMAIDAELDAVLGEDSGKKGSRRKSAGKMPEPDSSSIMSDDEDDFACVVQPKVKSERRRTPSKRASPAASKRKTPTRKAAPRAGRLSLVKDEEILLDASDEEQEVDSDDDFAKAVVGRKRVRTATPRASSPPAKKKRASKAKSPTRCSGSGKKGKKAAPEVISLSDDDDDEPVRPRRARVSKAAGRWGGRKTNA